MLLTSRILSFIYKRHHRVPKSLEGKDKGQWPPIHIPSQQKVQNCVLTDRQLMGHHGQPQQ